MDSRRCDRYLGEETPEVPTALQSEIMASAWLAELAGILDEDLKGPRASSKLVSDGVWLRGALDPKEVLSQAFRTGCRLTVPG